jgi:hypothetical protein
MSGFMGSSESGFHPPAANFAMVKRSMAYTATIRPINAPQVETCTVDGYMSNAGARHQEIVHKPTDSTSDILKSQNGEKTDILTDDWVDTIVMTRGATGARFVNPENGRCYYRIVSIDALLKKEAELQHKWETEHGRSWSDRLLIRLEPPAINCRRKDATPLMAKSDDRMFATSRMFQCPRQFYPQPNFLSDGPNETARAPAQTDKQRPQPTFEDFSDIQEVLETECTKPVDQRLHLDPMPKVKAPASANTTHREKWFTNGCTRKPPLQVSDLLEMHCINYYAALNAEETEDGAEGESPIQNEDDKKISADENALIRPVGDPSQNAARGPAATKRHKRTRKRGRKPTMRGVHFTGSPPVIPRPRSPGDNSSLGNDYSNIRLSKYCKIYRMVGKSAAQAFVDVISECPRTSELRLMVDACDPTSFSGVGVITQVEMNGNYGMDFEQGQMRYISDGTLQENLHERKVECKRSEWIAAIQREIESLIHREAFGNIEADITESVPSPHVMPNAGPSGSQATSVSNPRVQWIRSTLALCVGLGLLYTPMLMTIPLLHLALTTILFLMAGHVIDMGRVAQSNNN